MLAARHDDDDDIYIYIYTSLENLPIYIPGPLCPGVVAPDRALSMGWVELSVYLWQAELFD